jgi:hypothetical protein
MNAEIERQHGIAVLAAPKPLNPALLAFTPSMSVLRRIRVFPGGSWPRAGQHEQVIGEHPQPDPPLHAAGASVATPTKSVTTFQCADPSFAACAPAQSGARRTRPGLPRLARQHDVPHTAVLRSCAARSLLREANPPSATARCGA